MTLSVNSVAGSHRSQHERAGSAGRSSSRPELITRPTGARHPREIHARGVGALTPNRFDDHLGGEPSRFLMESLILAQDERWRRA